MRLVDRPFIGKLACAAVGALLAGLLPATQAAPVPLNPVDFNSPTGIQVVGQSSNSAIQEGQQAFFSFTVQNNTANFVLLDLAELVIHTPAVPDATDWPYDPVNVSFAPFIAPGGMGVYNYTASTDPADFGDFGVSPVTFQIYMSEIAAPPVGLPPVINTLLPCPAPAQFAGCTIDTFFGPAQTGPQHEADNFQNPILFRVNDMPEPASLALVGIAFLGLYAASRRRNPGAPLD